MVLRKSATEVKQEKNEKDIKTMTILQRLVFIKQAITVEPLIVCYEIGKALIDPALKNLELEKACRVNSQFNNTVCSDIIFGTYDQANFTEENDLVQSYITVMHSWQLTTTNVLAIILIIVLGSFSDHYRIRKPFILLTLFGQILATSGCILCVQFMNEWPLEVQGFLQEVVYAMFGGEKMLLMVIYAYISDISTPRMRTIRMATIQGMWNICNCIGQYIGGALSSNGHSYMLILSSALILFMTAFCYCLFMIEESKKSTEDISTKKMLLDVFNPRYITETFKIFSRYTGLNRINIISILMVHVTYSIVAYGELSVMFLFTQTAYEWTIAEFTAFTSMTTTANSVGLFIIVPLFTKVLHLDDLIIVASSYSSRILSNVIITAVRTPTGLYIGCAAGIMKTLAIVGIRSQLTKCVSEDDVGKILSMYTVVDSFGEGVSSQMYNSGIYEHTREIFPHAFLLLGIAILLVGMVILIYIYVRRKIHASKESKNHPTEVEAGSGDLGIETTYL